MSVDRVRHFAIYGGSFDPIHNGHLALAESAVNECGIDTLMFMPAYISPFKQGESVSAGKDRCAMIESVLYKNDAFTLSRYELDNEGRVSYTIETLKHFASVLEGKLSFVLGFDSIVQLDKWYQGESIIRNYPLITARRPDTDDCEGLAIIENFKRQYDADITVLNMPPIDASSTNIRALAARGESISNLVPSEVEEYIIEHNLYR